MMKMKDLVCEMPMLIRELLWMETQHEPLSHLYIQSGSASLSPQRQSGVRA